MITIIEDIRQSTDKFNIIYRWYHNKTFYHWNQRYCIIKTILRILALKRKMRDVIIRFQVIPESIHPL